MCLLWVVLCGNSIGYRSVFSVVSVELMSVCVIIRLVFCIVVCMVVVLIRLCLLILRLDDVVMLICYSILVFGVRMLGSICMRCLIVLWNGYVCIVLRVVMM